MTDSVRVLCVDDNRLMAEALKRRLGLDPVISWAGWVEHPEQTLATVATSSPDIVLLDIDMPGHDAFELVREIVARSPAVKVVMFSGHVRADYIDRAIDAGAWGYVSKSESLDDVLDAIRRVAAGEFVLTREVDGEYRRKG